MPGWTSSLLGFIITRHDGSHRGGHLMVRLVGKIEPGENSSPLFTESVIDPPHDIGPDDPSKSDTRRDAIVLEAHILKRVEHLPGIEERRNLKICYDPGQARSQDMNALLNTEGNQLLIDVPIDTKPAQIILSAQRALLIKRN